MTVPTRWDKSPSQIIDEYLRLGDTIGTVPDSDRQALHSLSHMLREIPAEKAGWVIKLLSIMRDPHQGFTPAEEAILKQANSWVEEPRPGAVANDVAVALAWQRIVAASYTPAQAASMLGVQEDVIRRRITDRTLYSIATEDGRLLPAFQFQEGTELPGWATVAPAFPDDTHVIGVERVLHQTYPDLVDETYDPMTPFAWLTSGRSPQKLADLLTGIYSGII